MEKAWTEPAAVYAPPKDGMPWVLVFFALDGEVIEAEGHPSQAEAVAALASAVAIPGDDEAATL